MHLQINPSLRISPQPFTNDEWIVEDLINKKQFKISIFIVIILLICTKPLKLNEIIKRITIKLNLTANVVSLVLEELMNNNLIVNTELIREDKNIQKFMKLQNWWTKYGWIEAAEYHLSTYDYPFIQSDLDGIKVANNLMKQYSEIELDENRVKRYSKCLKRIRLPYAKDLTNAIFTKDLDSSILNKDKLVNIISIVFTPTSYIKPSWKGKPLITRTSPSGGARHPTEGYVIVIDVPGVDPGWYHIQIEPPSLVLISKSDRDLADLVKIMPSLITRTPFTIKAIFVLTSIFERNMFRYREPRTFRTIHMDGGHIAGNIELLASLMNIKSFIQYTCKEEILEKKLKINGLKEGFLLCIAIG